MAKHALKSPFNRQNLALLSTFFVAAASLALSPISATAATSVGAQSSRVLVQPSSDTQISAQLTGANEMVISGFGSSPSTDLVRVEITESGSGQIKFPSVPTGLTAVTGGNPIDTNPYDSLAFTASVNDANAALASLNYVSSSSFGTASISIVVSYAGTTGDLYAFNPDNEHFYKFVSTAVTWTAAKTAAEASTFNGLKGYLATSTSANENSFITNRVGTAQAWLGGADGGTTGGTDRQWRWVGGPANEKNKRFFDQNSVDVSGAPNGSNYTGDGLNYSNFGNGEPNGNAGWDENALQIVAGGSGKWNDLKENDSGTKIGYVIEYGEMADDAIEKASTSRTITVDVNFPEVKATSGNCVQNISNTTGVTVSDPNNDGSKCRVTFTSTAAATNWRAPTGVTSLDVLVVGGGGSAGTYGGGGAGEFVEKLNQTVTAGNTYSVSVGAGGAVSNTSSAGNRGTGSNFDTISAGGGGGGGTLTSPRASIAATAGENGASSGGSVAGNADSSGVAGVAAVNDNDAESFGNSGGAGYSYGPSNGDYAYASGGGGGAGGSGGAGSRSGATITSGNGGAGKTSSITGLSYAGGGAGGANVAQTTAYTTAVFGTATAGGGSRAAGTANTGGGGGARGSTGLAGYAGGSGVVVIQYVGTGNPAITSHPANATKTPSQTATFTVAANSPDGGTLTYQWQVLTTAITAIWSDISGATSASYTTGSLTISNDGYKYRVVVTNTVGSAAKTITSNSATLTMSNIAVVDVAWNELNYDYTAGKYINKVGNGKAVNDKVLFKNVITRENTCVDSVVTTKTLSSGVVKNYESGTGAGGDKKNFEVDIDLSATNAYGEFQFDFYVCDTFDTVNERRVELRNLAITLIDIDYYQWNEATGMDSFTLASTTKLKYGPAGTTLTTANVSIPSFPASVRFQGPSSIDSTIPEDQAIINYGAIQTFNIKMGRSASGSPNYFGVAFKSLTWGSTTPATQGPVTTYNITYDGNSNTGGTSPNTQNGKVGANFTVSGNTGTLTRTGYTFGGWNSKADGTGTTYAAGSAILMPTGGITLYAIWTAASFTLSYNANGGTGSPVSETRAAGSINNLSAVTPTRSGYVFYRWNTQADGFGSDYTSSGSYTMPGNNVTLYAKWNAATGTIAYNGNNKTGGAVPTGDTGSTGANYTVVGNTGSLVRTNYTFAGWNTAADGSGTDYATGAVITYPASGTTTTLYAQWTPVLYSLSYNANGGTGTVPPQSAIAGATVTLAASSYNPSRTGYTFAGWNTKADGTGTDKAAGATDFTMPGANTVLYAKWTPLTYTVTYNANGGTGTQADATGTYNNAATVTVAALGANSGTIIFTGKRFVGWNTAANGSGIDYIAGSTFTISSANVVLYAKWVDASVKLTFDANGGSLNGVPSQRTEVTGTTITISGTLPVRDGYTFTGWTEAQNGTGTNYLAGGGYVVPATDTVLYAKWTRTSYTFYYNANGGTSAPSSYSGLYIGYVYTLDANLPIRVGYTFISWNSNMAGSGISYSPSGSYTSTASDVTVWAQWQGNPFTLTYNSNGGTTLSPATDTRAAGSVSAITSSAPTRSGYTFSGWNTSANGSGTSYAASASLTMPAANLTLYAQWTAINSGVSYNANSGSGAPAGANYNFGDTVTVSSSVPTRTGYTFTGWNTQQGGGGTPYSAADTFNMPNSAVVLWAQWTATVYSLDYDANGGSSAPGLANYAYAATATVSSSVPTRTGYDFLGWNITQAGNGTARSSGATFSMPANNMTLYAQWSLATYTVYYNANGGTGSITPQPGRYNTTITLSNTIPTRSGYTFGGWNTGADGSGVDYIRGGSLTIPGNNVTLYAKWTANTYTLTYDANGGTNAPAAEAGKTVAQQFSLSASAPNRSGYWFNGWTTQADGGGSSYASSATYTMGAADVTLYARWVLNTYTLTYNANGGTGAPSDSQTVGGNVTISGTIPTRPGYTFLEWNTEPSGNTGTAKSGTFNPGGNLVVYARWTANTIRITYNINTGTGTTPDYQEDVYGATIQLAGSGGFSKASSTFLSWNTIADGTGTNYAAEQANFALPSTSITLYAIWSSAYVALEYNPAGGSGAPSEQYAAPGSNVNVAPSEPTKSGYDFTSWTDAATGNTYSAGSSITMPSSNVVLVANYVRRSSVSGGGSPVTEIPVTETLTLPMKMKQTVYFKGDRSYLTAATKKLLKALATKAKKYGYAADITIYGRVKETNDKSYDLKLSKARATNVANYLKKLGVTGKFKIIAAGISPENKPVSRRVDMSLYWPKKN